jgi:D-glycero-alpha-D-manno-heptose-7-phosphate kinase
MTTYSYAPPGSGLGSSSALVVAMRKAYQELLNLPLGDYELARLAYEIERCDARLQGGRQDQYSATFGGFNFMEFYANDRVIVNPLRIKNWILSELEASLLLFYTGVSRESAHIIAEQSDNVTRGATEAVEAMHAIKLEAVTMKESLLRGEFTTFVESMRQSWESKKRTASAVTNPLLDEIYAVACAAGALAGKISGAGGGGFMMLFVDPVRRMDVSRALERFNGQVRNCHFTKHGTQGWRIG